MAIVNKLVVTGDARHVGDTYLSNVKSGEWNGQNLDASQINIADAGGKYVATDVEAALQEIATSITTAGGGHGSITKAGAVTDTATIASGDRLLITDNSDSNLVKASGIQFGTATSTYLRNDGTWATPTDNNTDTKVKQTVTSSGGASYRPIVLGYCQNNALPFAPTDTAADQVYLSHSIKVLPSEGNLRLAGNLTLGGGVTTSTDAGYCKQEYDATNKCLNFTFA